METRKKKKSIWEFSRSLRLKVKTYILNKNVASWIFPSILSDWWPWQQPTGGWFRTDSPNQAVGSIWSRCNHRTLFLRPKEFPEKLQKKFKRHSFLSHSVSAAGKEEENHRRFKPTVWMLDSFGDRERELFQGVVGLRHIHVKSRTIPQNRRSYHAHSQQPWQH